MTPIGLPKTLPPKSSPAICAAVTEPWPDGVDAGPFMSVSTPILTTSSDTCAEAADDSSASARPAARDSVVIRMNWCLPVLRHFGRLREQLKSRVVIGQCGPTDNAPIPTMTVSYVDCCMRRAADRKRHRRQVTVLRER